MKNFFSKILIALLALILISCGGHGRSSDVKEVNMDLPAIKERGSLRAITTYSATSYFIYRGRPMGYEYELLTRLADHLNLNLEIVIAKNLDSLISMLKKGDGDIIAHGLAVTQQRKERVAFATPHTVTRQVLVQRLPEKWRDMMRHEIEEALIRNPIDLIGKKVYVRKNSSYYQRLINLSDEIGGDIDIELVPGDLATEDLIAMVAEGEIDYTIADQYIAAINKTYHPDLDIKTAISFPQHIAWAVRKSSPQLLEAINDWIYEMKKGLDYYVIYNKYFKNTKAFKRRKEFSSYPGGKISAYDDLIKKHAAVLKWDWSLLASMIYQESRFDPEAESWAGAKGLMQLMPAMAKRFGLENLSDPEENIEAGTEYVLYLQELWDIIPDSLERIKFILASYNVGENHVSDARRLADKYGADPNLWNGNVAKYLRLKSKKKYYNDDVVKYGYCRGDEPYKYVNEIFERYDHYRTVIEFNSKPGT
ncbi:MAG: transporter substrate-binding domain-containing protein [candidate division Zixibacteria bacterium]|nr:transporter substrate-binding domain-containing protein [candidate division Zixibacteria bacterium]NIR66706.1 transporter substrate-binding domain-containing protein [candidate division Zixibacteria bacterium]NIS14895.1 transporter substrate-binding domain-containing protein [candidate division Zixibacteria bacterium]NIS48245.1 transporter substrate-binding domain-containing protein [candidate division Zixibacteria bacterium]NIT51414.1 transporter substrate-binding domain-containing protein 